MNTKRKFLHMVDLRVQRYFAGRKGIGYPHAEHEQAQGPLVADTSLFKGLAVTDAVARPSAL
jgi:hypothetical protein